MRFAISSIWDDAKHSFTQGDFGNPSWGSGGLGQPSLLTQAPLLGANPFAPAAYAPAIAAPQISTGIGADPAVVSAALLNGPMHMMDTQLAAMALHLTGSMPTAALQAFGALHADANGHQYVAIDFSAKDGNGAALLHQLEGIGLQQGASFGNAAGGLLPVDQLLSLVGISDLAHASVSLSMHNTGNVDTQADATLLAQAARFTYAGIDGTGITIGVMSDSFNVSGNGSTATDQASGDLPSVASGNLVVLHDNTSGEDEGRGMSQLVHDLAPGAKIVFSDSGSSEAGMAQHILDLMNAGCKVIVDDITYLNEPAYQDGPISQAVKTFTDAGGIYLTSAANQARNSFETTTSQLSGSTVNTEQALKLTTGASNQQFIQVTIPDGANVTFILQWDQPYGTVNAAHAAAKDLNLYGFNAAGTALFSAGSQDTSNQVGGDPIAGFAVSNSSGADEVINLAVTLAPGTTAADIHDFKIFGFKAGGGSLAFQASSLNTNSGTVFGHATSTAFAVGAVPYFYTPYSEAVDQYGDTSPLLEDFSSAGFGTIYYDTAGNRLASPILRTGPQFSSVDGGNTTFFGSDDGVDTDTLPNFYGTSAAAPDAAAIVVLMLQANPLLNRMDVLNLLQDSSWDITRRVTPDGMSTTALPVGFDTDSGSGLINAQLAVTAAQTGIIQPTALQTQFMGTHLDDTFVFDLKVSQTDPMFPPFTLAERFLKGTDRVDGGAGNDTVTLNGDYATTPLVFTATTMVNVERLLLKSGHSYNLTTADATIAAGATLTVDASALGAANALTLNATTETNGFLNILGGLGADVVRFTATNLSASDIVNGGTGASLDSLIFNTAGTIAASAFQQVTHIEQVFLVNGTNSVTLPDAMVSSADDGQTLTVIGGTGNDFINAAGVTTTTNHVVFKSGSGNDTLAGGLGADTFYFAVADLTASDIVNGNTGAALDRIVFTTAGTIAAGIFQNVTHVEQLVLANGTNAVVVPNALVTSSDGHILYVTGGTGNDTVDASAVTTTTNRVYITAGAGNDTLTGGLGLDVFYFTSADLTSADTVNGGGGGLADTLAFTTAGTIAAAAFTGVSHIEEVVLANGTNSVTLTDALVTSADDGHLLYAFGNAGNDTVNASAVTTATNRVFFVSAAGNDTLTGGAGADAFFFSVANLTAADTVNGGTGASLDTLIFSSAGTIGAAAFTGVSHIEQITLFNGANNLTLTDALVTSADDSHVLHVTGGTGGDTISAAAVTTATNRVVFIGGGGTDSLTGGAGADIFSYVAITDSSSTVYDTITALNFNADRVDLPVSAGTVSLIEGTRTGQLDSGASFDTELGARFSTLAAHHAGLLTVSSGTLNGQTFLVVDCNGVAGYQANADLVLHLVSQTGTLATGDFV